MLRTTGRSLQPIHYEQFIANYVSLIALVLTAAVLWSAFKPARKISALVLIVIAVISTGRTFQEIWLAAHARMALSTIVDDSRSAGLRLAELARDPAEAAHVRSDVVLVLSPASFIVSDALPITAPANTTTEFSRVIAGTSEIPGNK